ncbi:MAG: FliH/SctL family protein [Xanthobacteraceae bacterium]
MRGPAKYLFDMDFSAGAKARQVEPTITLAEHAIKLAEAEAGAYRKGLAEAQTQAQASFQRMAAVALERVGAELSRLHQGLEAVAAGLESEAIEVAVAVAKKLAPELIAREPFVEIAALARECFRHLIGAPHVVVRVNEALHATAREQIEQVARGRGFEGRLVVLGDTEIALGDCRIEWADGGINRDRAAVEATVTEAVTRYIRARMTTTTRVGGEPKQ